MKISDEFWAKWIAADDIERVNLIKTLTIPPRELDDEQYKHIIATLINSYLEDLQEYLLFS
jgi:hypothetical protein